MNHVKLAGKVTLAELQRQIDHIEEQLEEIPIRYPNPSRLGQYYEDKEESVR